MAQASHQREPSSSNHHKDEANVSGFMGERLIPSPEDQDCLDPLTNFMDQVDQRPESIAAVNEGEHLTYQELNRRANQLSHWLQRQGVGPETIVGLCLDRSISLVVTILGVIKAGGCLLPLDPSYPRNRLTYMVEDCQPLIVLTHERYVDVFQKGVTRSIRINAIENNLAGESSQNPANLLRTGNLRVIFYTSGSTGQPKGVMEIYHDVISPPASDEEPDPDPAPLLKVISTDRMLVKCPISFAPFLWELMSPLFAGGTAILAASGGEQDFSYLIRVIANEAVTISHFVPSSLRVFLEQPDIKGCTSLATVCCSGEILSNTIRERFFATLHADIFLTYAATEAPGATWVHLHRDNFRQPLKLDQQKTTKVYVLDSAGIPVPVHQKGELYVEASPRVRGYFHQPALTAEKFVPDPFRATPGTRLYRTGDLADHLPDGNFHVVGRKDHQVKIRGFRIELSEIEASLRHHPHVRDVAVLSLKDTLGDNRLVAYILPASGASLDVSLLRMHLRTSLPEYMLPSVFMYLEAWPLTPNGKVDKGALPIPKAADRTQRTGYVAPRHELELLLGEIWRDLLKVEPIGIHDNFFELGGHSLLATQVVARIRAHLQMDVSVRLLFEAPTIAGLAKNLEALRALNLPDQTFPLCPQNRDGPLPLSFAQQRLWFLEQWAPDSTAYLLPYAWRLRGRLDPSALQASLTALIARHESFRTTFSVVDGHPVQIIAPEVPVSLSLRDLSPMPASAVESELQHLILQETQQPFNLLTGPLWRGQLLCLGAEDHVFLLTLHHIITDGWSMGILLRELSSLYAAQVTDQRATLPPLPIQYADFSNWQRQWLQGNTLDRQLTYWRSQLAGAPPTLDLPTDAPRPPQQTYRGDHITFTLPSSLTQAIKRLSQQEEVTVFMVLLGAFQTLLARYSGQCDILVGTPIAGRTHTELENLIGFFVNTLVIRTQFKGQLTVRELLHQVRETCLEAYTHQDVPFEKLVEVLHPVRDPSRHPLFQVMFQLDQPDSTGKLLLPGTDVVSLVPVNHIAKFDLSLSLVMKGETLQGTVIFNTDLFESATITRLAIHYHTLLEGLVTDSTQAINHLPVLGDAERHQLLLEWNPPVSLTPPFLCIHQLFEAQAAQIPETIAVVFDIHHLTYQTLNERANQVAHFLRGLGVGPEVRVGICLERGWDLIIGLLGILKAGGVYVPLDPSTPQERLRFMLEDAEVAVVLTSAILRKQLGHCLGYPEAPNVQGRSVIALDMMEWPCTAHEGIASPPPAVHPENLAYVMYTSGSTGRPKGVGIPHRGVVRLIRHPTYLKWPTQVVCLQLASPAFDAATFEIWACLIQGGKLVLGSASLPSLDELGVLLQQHHVTVLWLTAGLFHQMVDWNLKALSPVQTLLAGGDVLSPQHVKRVAEHLPTCQLINGYGPTENTTFTCCHSISQVVDIGNSVPIGRPLAQTQVYVLDANQNLMPGGMAGEILIGGLGLARGYVRQQDVTAEKFIPHPFPQEPGARLYRTGDMGRYRHDGTLEFVGRKDHQVKIRGYRIECGEIEIFLTTHPAVQEVVVLPCEDDLHTKRLVAYIVPKKGSNLHNNDLRNFLSRSLPSYMIPVNFVSLDAFPLTPNGKVDRRRLPLDNRQSYKEEKCGVAPRNAFERQLTKIWESVLHTHPIGVTDNFFNLGGESLLALRLCSEMERALHRKIPLPLIFHAQTIEQLAKLIGQGHEDVPLSLLVPVQPGGSNPPIFCFGFGSNFRRYLDDYPKQPVYMFLNPGHDGRPVRNTSVKKIATQCLKELRTVQPRGPYYLAGYSFGGLVVYEMAQQLRRQGETPGLLALVDPTTPLSNPSSSPSRPIRAHWLTLPRLRANQESIRGNMRKISSTIFKKALRFFQWKWHKLRALSWIRIRKILCHIYFGFRYPLPTFLRRFYRDIIVKHAARQYAPQNYSGQIVIFQTKIFVENYWSKLCAEVVQIYDLSCKHGDIYLDRPHTSLFLNQLMTHLEKAQKK